MMRRGRRGVLEREVSKWRTLEVSGSHNTFNTTATYQQELNDCQFLMSIPIVNGVENSYILNIDNCSRLPGFLLSATNRAIVILNISTTEAIRNRRDPRTAATITFP